MKAFPRLSAVYAAWAEKVQSTGNVKIVTCREVLRVKRDKKVTMWSRPTEGTDNDQQVVKPAADEIREEFDEMILACDADAALHILGADASWKERRVLGNVKVRRHVNSQFSGLTKTQYLWDISVTHNDVDYMQRVGQMPA